MFCDFFNTTLIIILRRRESAFSNFGFRILCFSLFPQYECFTDTSFLFLSRLLFRFFRDDDDENDENI